MEFWFDTGLVMEDAKTKRTVCAYSEIAADEYRAKGWKPVKKKSVLRKKVSVNKRSAAAGANEDGGVKR